MLANFGYGALIISFLISLYGVFAAVYGVRTNKPAWVESARLAMLLTFPLITLAALCLILLLVNGNYELEYVSSVTSNSMPLYLRITALWGGLAVGPLHAQSDAQVQRALDTWYKRAKRRAPGEWGIAVADQTGRTAGETDR